MFGNWDLAKAIQAAAGAYILGRFTFSAAALQVFEATSQQGPHALVAALGRAPPKQYANQAAFVTACSRNQIEARGTDVASLNTIYATNFPQQVVMSIISVAMKAK